MNRKILISLFFFLFSVTLSAGGDSAGGISDPVVSSILSGEIDKIKDLLSEDTYAKEKNIETEMYSSYEKYKSSKSFFSKLFESDEEIRREYDDKKRISDLTYKDYESFLRFKVNKTDEFGRTPLMWAATLNYDDEEKKAELEEKRALIVNLLIEKGADVKAVDRDGWNALHWGAWSGVNSVVRILIDRGCDLKQEDKNKWTPLMVAAYKGYPLSTYYLLENGSDESTKNIEGLNALMLARKGLRMNPDQEKRFHFTISLLGGADLNQKLDKNGNTLLSIYALEGNLKAVSILIKKGANITLKNNIGQTAADIALSEKARLSKEDGKEKRVLVYDEIVNRLN